MDGVAGVQGEDTEGPDRRQGRLGIPTTCLKRLDFRQKMLDKLETYFNERLTGDKKDCRQPTTKGDIIL